jgi:hypothetical protein
MAGIPGRAACSVIFDDIGDGVVVFVLLVGFCALFGNRTFRRDLPAISGINGVVGVGDFCSLCDVFEI